MKGFNILFLSIPSIVHASVVQNRGALLNRASIGTVVDCGDGIGIGVGPCPSSSVTSNPSTITPTAALSTTRTGSVVSSHAAITSASSGSVVSSHAAITSASSGSETIGRCGPTSVSTIPGCWGTPGCAYYLAADQGQPSGSPNWCQCDQYTVPLLTQTVSGKATTDCDYATMPTANIPLAAATASGTATASSGASGASGATQVPCSTDSPAWALTQDNWVDAKVDANLYAWWHGTSDTSPAGVPPAPVTSNDASKSAFGLAQQLVSKAAGVQTFQCQIGADINCIAPQGNFCKYQNLPRWAYFAWVSMSELHQTMKALSTNSADAIKQAQALATDLITSFEVDAGNSALFIGQSVFQILGTIITIAGVLTPMPKGVGHTRPLPNVEPKPPDDVAAIYGLVPGITISGVAGVWERFQDAATDEQAKVGDLELILVALQNNVSAIIEAYNDLMFWDAAGADDLMNLLSGGFFLQPTNVSNADANTAWSTDILSRVINSVWRDYPTYVSFTDLADDSDGSKCKADKVGPQGAKYCADGGVYYLMNYVNTNVASLGKPNGYDDLSAHGIDPVKIVTASAEAYRAKGIIVGNPPISAFDDVANKIVLEKIGDGSGEDLLGSLPGEWTLPVCDQGTNHWVIDYETASPFDDAGNLPCACGVNGKETSDFLTTANFGNSAYVFAGWPTLRNQCSSLLNTPTADNPGWSGINGGPPDTLDFPDGYTITKGKTCKGGGKSC